MKTLRIISMLRSFLLRNVLSNLIVQKTQSNLNTLITPITLITPNILITLIIHLGIKNE